MKFYLEGETMKKDLSTFLRFAIAFFVLAIVCLLAFDKLFFLSGLFELLFFVSLGAGIVFLVMGILEYYLG